MLEHSWQEVESTTIGALAPDGLDEEAASDFLARRSWSLTPLRLVQPGVLATYLREPSAKRMTCFGRFYSCLSAVARLAKNGSWFWAYTPLHVIGYHKHFIIQRNRAKK